MQCKVSDREEYHVEPMGVFTDMLSAFVDVMMVGVCLGFTSFWNVFVKKT